MPIDSNELDKTLQRVLNEAKHEAIRRLEKELGETAHGNLELVLDTLETLLKTFNAAAAPDAPSTGGGGSGLARLADLAAGLAGNAFGFGQPAADSGGLQYSLAQQLVRQFDQQQQAERKR